MDPPGIPGCGSESGDAGEPVHRFKDGQISTGGAEELGGEDGSESGMLSRVCLCRCSVTFSLISASSSAMFLQPHVKPGLSVRRIPSGVRCLVSSNTATFEWL